MKFCAMVCVLALAVFSCVMQKSQAAKILLLQDVDVPQLST